MPDGVECAPASAGRRRAGRRPLFSAGSWCCRVIFTEHLSTGNSRSPPARPDSSRGRPGGEAADDPQARWIFATNWSLHPEEIVEFVAPCLFGTQTGDLRHHTGQARSYARLGRASSGLCHSRQHTIYPADSATSGGVCGRVLAEGEGTGQGGRRRTRSPS